MKHIKLWYPSTCKCLIHELWEDQNGERVFVSFVSEEEAEAVNEERRKNGIPTVEERVKPAVTCDAHANLSGNALFDTIQKENQAIGELAREVWNTMPELFETVTIDGQQETRYKKGKEPIWSFDETRKLKYKLPNKKASLNKAILKINYPIELL